MYAFLAIALMKQRGISQLKLDIGSPEFESFDKFKLFWGIISFGLNQINSPANSIHKKWVIVVYCVSERSLTGT